MAKTPYFTAERFVSELGIDRAVSFFDKLYNEIDIICANAEFVELNDKVKYFIKKEAHQRLCKIREEYKCTVVCELIRLRNINRFSIVAKNCTEIIEKILEREQTAKSRAEKIIADMARSAKRNNSLEPVDILPDLMAGVRWENDHSAPFVPIPYATDEQIKKAIKNNYKRIPFIGGGVIVSFDEETAVYIDGKRYKKIANAK